MSDYSPYHFIGVNAVRIQLMFQFFFPSLFDFNLAIELSLVTFTLVSSLLIRSFVFVFFLLLVLSFVFLFFYLVDLEKVLFIRYLLPLRNVDSVISINIDFVFTNLLKIGPLLFLLFCHYQTFRRFIVLYLSYIIDEARIPCLLTNV